jgi:hypothetical protein
MSNFVFRGVVRNSIGEAVPGVEIYVCNQPLTSGTNIPPAPLASLYASATAPNSASIETAVYIGGFIEFTFTAALPADVLPGSFIAVSGVAPTGYNQVWQVVTMDTVNNIVTVTLPFQNFAPNPGTYVSGGSVATSALPNPVLTDGNGNFSFYTASGFYTLVVFDPADRIPTVFLPDTAVLSSGAGTVTSVAMTVPSGFAITGSPITGAGTLGLGYSSDWSIGQVIAGPESGSSTTPTRRRLTATDIDGLSAGTVSSVGLSESTDSNITAIVTGSPVTSSGVLALQLALANIAANAVIMGPQTGAAAPPTSRVPQPADLTAWGAVQLGADLGGTSPNLPEVIGFLGTGKIELPLFFFNNGITADGAKLFRNTPPIGQTWKFAAGAPDASGIASVAATSNATFTFKKNGTPFATLLYAASSAAGVWTQTADGIFVGGTDYLEVDCPATHDATLADIGITYPYLRVQ